MCLKRNRLPFMNREPLGDFKQGGRAVKNRARLSRLGMAFKKELKTRKA